MIRKRIWLAGALGLAGMVAPTAALADEYYVQCDASTCYEIECREMPNINGTGQSGYGCAVVNSYPRPREVNGE